MLSSVDDDDEDPVDYHTSLPGSCPTDSPPLLPKNRSFSGYRNFPHVVIAARSSEAARKNFRSGSAAPRDRRPLLAGCPAIKERRMLTQVSVQSLGLPEGCRKPQMPRSLSASSHLCSSPGDSSAAPPRTFSALAFLHCGTTEAAADGRWLCANKISHLINLSGTSRPHAIQCPCPRSEHHEISEYRSSLPKKDSTPAIHDEFVRINAFIAGARSRKSHVLVFSTAEAVGAVQAVALQHIMHYHRLTLAHSLAHIQKNATVTIDISKHLMNALIAWQEYTQQSRPGDGQ